jgi:hypothetical protein
MTDAAKEMLARRIETNPLGWLPGSGDVINITFTPEEALLLTTTLRSAPSVKPDCAEIERRALEQIIDHWTGDVLKRGYASSWHYGELIDAIRALPAPEPQRETDK